MADVAEMADMESALGSFLWYDLETTGTHAASDRIMQFAGQRTDAELRPLGEPFATYIRLAPDVLPSPEACLVTGITPQRAEAEGVEEWQALADIRALLLQPETCIAGYNNLRFDDDFLRHGFYRNLFDPYAHEWQDGNSRWDLIDVARAACALRPDGIRWPYEEGAPSFKLGQLSAANGIGHDGPHDALADVRATIGFARLLKAAQPKLWRFALDNRSRQAAEALLLPIGQPLGAQACVHVSQRFSNERFCCAPVVAVARHPEIDSRAIVADLGRDIAMLLDCDAGELAERLFAPREEGDAERPPLETVVLNRCPFLAPLAVARGAAAARLGFDADVVEERRRTLASAPGLAEKIADVYRTTSDREPAADAELALYDAFIDDADKRAMQRLQEALAQPGGAPWPALAFRDGRLRTLAERLKARLHPEEIDADERQRWQGHIRQCLGEGFGARPSLEKYRSELAALGEEAHAAGRRTLDELADFAMQREAGAPR